MEGVLDKMRLLPKLSELGSFFPKRVKWGVGQEAAEADNMSLSALPVTKCWPQEGHILTKD
jgi:4-hydroxy-3-polyprenylbenzoate decarboxylase